MFVKVQLRDNPRFTAQILIWLSTSLPQLRALDLRDCPELDLVKGMNEMINLQQIVDLRLGPSRHRFDPDSLLRALLYLTPQLRTLHLHALADLTDEHLAEAVDSALELRELLLADMDTATLTVEAICSSIPNISRLALVGSRALQDIDMRCLTSVCRNIKELTVQRCPKLSDAGFTRCITLKILTKLDVADCSPGRCSGTMLKFFSLSPLRELVMDGCDMQQFRDCFTALMPTTLLSLQRVSLRRCAGVTPEDVQYLLSRYVGCASLDLSECPQLPGPAAMGALVHTHPFLEYEISSRSDFSGYSVHGRRLALSSQFWAIRAQLRRHYGARLMQRLRRRYLQWLEQLKQQRRDNWSDFKMLMAVKIQRVQRGRAARRRVAVLLWAGRRLVRGARDWLVYREYLKSRTARAHYRAHLKRLLLNLLRGVAASSLSRLQGCAQGVAARRDQHLLRGTFRELRRLEVKVRDLKFEQSATVLWEIRFLGKILRHWRNVVFETAEHKQRLVRVFMQCASLETYNSFASAARARTAQHFCTRRIVMVAWLNLARSLLELRRVNALVPVALSHAQKTFYRRVVGGCFGGFRTHWQNRLYKKHAFKKGIKHEIYFSKLIGCRYFWDRKNYLQEAKRTMQRAAPQMSSFLTRLALSERFPSNAARAKDAKGLRALAVDHYEQRLVEEYWKVGKVNVVKSKQWRVMNRKAEILRDKNGATKAFFAWNEFKKYNKNLGPYYYKLYLQKVARRMMHALRVNVGLNKDYLRTITAELLRRSGSQEQLQHVLYMLRRFQAIVRGNIQLRNFTEEKVNKLYSVQVLQNWVRTVLARKDFGGRLRKLDIAERVNEDTELDLMREADAEAHYYAYQLRAIVDFQRVFRGWKGRIIGADRAVGKPMLMTAAVCTNYVMIVNLGVGGGGIENK